MIRLVLMKVVQFLLGLSILSTLFASPFGGMRIAFAQGPAGFPQPPAQWFDPNTGLRPLYTAGSQALPNQVAAYDVYLRQLYEWYGKNGANPSIWNYDQFMSELARNVNAAMNPATNYGRPLSSGSGGDALKFRGERILDEIKRIATLTGGTAMPVARYVATAIGGAAAAASTTEFGVIPFIMPNPCYFQPPPWWLFDVCYPNGLQQ